MHLVSFRIHLLRNGDNGESRIFVITLLDILRLLPCPIPSKVHDRDRELKELIIYIKGSENVRVLGCVILPLALRVSSHNLVQTF